MPLAEHTNIVTRPHKPLRMWKPEQGWGNEVPSEERIAATKKAGHTASLVLMDGSLYPIEEKYWKYCDVKTTILAYRDAGNDAAIPVPMNVDYVTAETLDFMKQFTDRYEWAKEQFEKANEKTADEVLKEALTTTVEVAPDKAADAGKAEPVKPPAPKPFDEKTFFMKLCNLITRKNRNATAEILAEYENEQRNHESAFADCCEKLYDTTWTITSAEMFIMTASYIGHEAFYRFMTLFAATLLMSGITPELQVGVQELGQTGEKITKQRAMEMLKRVKTEQPAPVKTSVVS